MPHARCLPDRGMRGLTATWVEAGPDLGGRLAALDPDVVVVIDPDAVAVAALDGLAAARLGVLVDGAAPPSSGLDRVVACDHGPARPDVWRTLPLPVADRLFRPADRLRGLARPLAFGPTSAEREAFLASAVDLGLTRVPRTPSVAEVAGLLGAHDVGIVGPDDPHGHAALHLAAGHLLLAPTAVGGRGLEPGIDYVVVETEWEVGHVLRRLGDLPGTWHSARVRGRRKAEHLRASRVWSRLLHDLRAELAFEARS